MKTSRSIIMAVVATFVCTTAPFAATVTETSPYSATKPQTATSLPEKAPKAPAAGISRIDTKVPGGPTGADRKSPAPVPPQNINKSVLPRNTKNKVPIGAAPGRRKTTTTLTPGSMIKKGVSSEDLMGKFMRLGVEDPGGGDSGGPDTSAAPLPAQTVVVTWGTVMQKWDFFRTSFRIYLDNHGSGSGHQNNSYIEIGSQRWGVNLPAIGYTGPLLKHRFLIDDMSGPAGMNVTLARHGSGVKQGSGAMQLLLVTIPFETGGVEVKRFNKSLSALQSNWCDGCEADCDLTNPDVVIKVALFENNGHLDAQIDTDFHCGVDASTNTFNTIVIQEMHQRIISNTRLAIDNAFSLPGIKNHILTSLDAFLRAEKGLTHGEQIAKYEVKDDGIYITYTGGQSTTPIMPMHIEAQ